MNPIEVTATPAPDGWTCRVTVRAGTTTEHDVRVTQRDLDRLDPGAAEPTALVRRSFEFLLEREPNTSILPRFDLPEIGRYFPEYERRVRAER